MASTIISLTANTAASVTFTRTPYVQDPAPPNIYETQTYGHERKFGSVEIVNRDGVDEVWFTTNGELPTVGGDDCAFVPAVVGGSCSKSVNTADLDVWMISDGNVLVYVEAL